jgi:DnaJ like chaperone protein
MAIFKILGSIVGWAVGGPIGGLIGFAVGAAAEQAGDSQPQINQNAGRRRVTHPGDFASALLVLSAAVMKADDKLMKSELDFIREFYAKNFGAHRAAEQIGILKQLLKKDIPVYEVSAQIRANMEYSQRLQLMYYLFGIAQSDGEVHAKEAAVISQIAQAMGINTSDVESLRAMYFKDTGADYKILEIEKSATDEEVKKAYRKMAIKYHPDKVRDLGEEHQKAAQEKFLKVQEAYENIKKERKMV